MQNKRIIGTGQCKVFVVIYFARIILADIRCSHLKCSGPSQQQQAFTRISWQGWQTWFLSTISEFEQC